MIVPLATEYVQDFGLLFFAVHSTYIHYLFTIQSIRCFCISNHGRVSWGVGRVLFSCLHEYIRSQSSDCVMDIPILCLPAIQCVLRSTEYIHDVGTVSRSTGSPSLFSVETVVCVKLLNPRTMCSAELRSTR